MKRIILSFYAVFLLIGVTNGQNFKFAHVTDTHVGSKTGAADLERTVTDINNQYNLDFVILSGDITEMGTNQEIKAAENIINKLDIPYYIIPGNHDTGWSESGGVSFLKAFGNDKFVFDHKGYRFIGCASGPYVRMSDGHIPRDAVIWLNKVLDTTSKQKPIVFVNHYPLDSSLDNWYEAVDKLKEYNTQLAICGHGHQNKIFDFEGIPGIMGRSNLRAGEPSGGYNIVEIDQDTAYYRERLPGQKTLEAWAKIPMKERPYSESGEKPPRPSYAVNDSFMNVKKIWEYHSGANVISTPASVDGKIIFGNSKGDIEAISEKDGTKLWSYKTQGGIFSSPASFHNSIIVGSGDSNIYCLTSEGKLKWKVSTGASVLGSPIVKDGKVYIGGSDGKFRAIDAENGNIIWTFTGIGGAIVSKPLIYKDQIYFGAWDKNLYALNMKDGSLSWKWTNGKGNRMFSPAMVIPVAAQGAVFIVAPDRYITALDAETGKELWRSNEVSVRESLGISNDNKLLYAKTMNDSIVAFRTNREKADLAWSLNLEYGYDHVPSMLIEKDGEVYFGGRNGVIFSVDPKDRKLNWSYKIDNSMVNTVNVLDKHSLTAATMDGKVVLLKWQ